MGFRRICFSVVVLALLGAGAPPPYSPPAHTQPAPELVRRAGRAALASSTERGFQIEEPRSVAETLDRHEKLARVATKLAPQRPGVVDAYVIAAALDSDGVFAREARETAKLLERRYDAAGRTVLLSGSDGSGPSNVAIGSPDALAIALGRVAKVMDRQEDVLVLFTTSHGFQSGVVYHDGDTGYGGISPARLAAMLDELGIRRRLLFVSACYSGVFADRLAAPDTAIITAAHATRTSFGCAAGNDWTFFGDALINRALRKPQSLEAAFQEASIDIALWEGQVGAQASLPQVRVGEGARAWLKLLDARMPAQMGAPVGRPSTELIAAGRR